jgi:23S rRNA-/tRNA-specific pseudouridylate synthase
MSKLAQDRRVLSMLKKKHSTGKHLPRGLEVLYEDRDILVVDKPAGHSRREGRLASRIPQTMSSATEE